MNIDVLKKRIAVASGKEKADLVIKNGKIINVFTRDIMSGDIAIFDGFFVGIGNYEGNNEIDAEGRYIAPGLIDGHVHIESSMVTPSEFAKTVLPHGVTAVITDPHEIANVAGTVGIQFMLEASEHIPFDVFVMLPSSVPATEFEHSGARLEVEDLAPLLAHPRVLGLAEVMNFPAVLTGEARMLDKISTIYNRGGIIDGHAAGLDTKGINVYMSAKIRTDHESVNIEEAKVRLDRGMYLMIRQGTGAKDLVNLITIINDHNSRRCLFVTDDKHLDDLSQEGSVDHNIRLAIKSGIHPITAIQMASLNVAECFNLREQGAIAPGYKADFIMISDLEQLTIEQVYKNGELVAKSGEVVLETFQQADIHIESLKKKRKFASLFRSVKLPPLNIDQLTIHIEDHEMANVIGIIPNSLITEHLVETVEKRNGQMLPSIEKDQLKLAVIERHHLTGNIGLGVVKGLGLKSGAIATTVGHDSHNLIIAGTNDKDMLMAAQVIEKQQGGIVIIKDAAILAFLSLSIAGLISNQNHRTVLQDLKRIESALKQIGANDEFNPFLTLSFLALPVIPYLKITDIGLFDVNLFRHIPIQVKKGSKQK